MEKFSINISEKEVVDLRERLSKTRFPPLPESPDFKNGTDGGYLKKMCEYWQKSFDWRKSEAEINALDHYTAEIGGEEIHYILAEGTGERNIPLLLIHGWPDSFLRFKKIIPLLTKPDENGNAFTLVIPSLPGYGFSTNRKENDPKSIAKIFDSLMTEHLGFKKYLVHGGDWGAVIAEKIGQYHHANLLGMHLTDVPFLHALQPPKNPTAAEEKFLLKMKLWMEAEGGYFKIQSTKPDSLAPGLNDSPAGLAAWILEKFRAGADDFEKFGNDDLLENLSLYWFTQTAGSAAHLYMNCMRSLMAEKMNLLQKLNPLNHDDDKVKIPVGISLFPKDIAMPPREFAERFYNLIYFSELSEGGHFAAMEVPEILEKEIRNFVKTAGIVA